MKFLGWNVSFVLLIHLCWDAFSCLSFLRAGLWNAEGCPVPRSTALQTPSPCTSPASAVRSAAVSTHWGSGQPAVLRAWFIPLFSDPQLSNSDEISILAIDYLWCADTLHRLYIYYYYFFLNLTSTLVTILSILLYRELALTRIKSVAQDQTAGGGWSWSVKSWLQGSTCFGLLIFFLFLKHLFMAVLGSRSVCGLSRVKVASLVGCKLLVRGPQ